MIRRLDVKIFLVLIVAVLLPMWVSIYIVSRAIETSLGLGLNSKIASQFEQSLEMRREHIEEVKRSVRLRFDGLVGSHSLATAIELEDENGLKETLRAFFEDDPSLRTIKLLHIDGSCIELESTQESKIEKPRAVPISEKITLTC